MFYLKVAGPNLERWETCLGQGMGTEHLPGAGWTQSIIISLGEQEESEWFRNKTLHRSMCHARQVKMPKIPPLLDPEKLCLKKKQSDRKGFPCGN